MATMALQDREFLRMRFPEFVEHMHQGEAIYLAELSLHKFARGPEETKAIQRDLAPSLEMQSVLKGLRVPSKCMPMRHQMWMGKGDGAGNKWKAQ